MGPVRNFEYPVRPFPSRTAPRRQERPNARMHRRKCGVTTMERRSASGGEAKMVTDAGPYTGMMLGAGLFTFVVVLTGLGGVVERKGDRHRSRE